MAANVYMTAVNFQENTVWTEIWRIAGDIRCIQRLLMITKWRFVTQIMHVFQFYFSITSQVNVVTGTCSAASVSCSLLHCEASKLSPWDEVQKEWNRTTFLRKFFPGLISWFFHVLQIFFKYYMEYLMCSRKSDIYSCNELSWLLLLFYFIFVFIIVAVIIMIFINIIILHCL